MRESTVVYTAALAMFAVIAAAINTKRRPHLLFVAIGLTVAAVGMVAAAEVSGNPAFFYGAALCLGLGYVIAGAFIVGSYRQGRAELI